jgi:tRNA-dihydrouridine synthase B
MTSLIEAVSKPLIIPHPKNPVTLHSRLMLAPMAGVTDVVFRALVRQWAPQSLICTEMISSNGLVYSKRTDARILDKTETDAPIAYQLAGHKADVLIEAAQTLIREKKPQTIDLNMGCPVKKITGNFEGCSLMREPELAYALISALVKEIDRPVTVKFRLGWDSASINYLEFGQMCQEAGASMVVLHARTRTQGYQPGCDWDAFGKLKQALKIPVIGNGDINTLADIQAVLGTYGIDGVMLGRATMGAPWLIGLLDTALKTGEPLKEPSLQQKMAIALDHARRQAQYLGESQGLREMRKHLPWYVSGVHGASKVRGQLTQVTTVADVSRILEELLSAQTNRHGLLQDCQQHSAA